LAGGKAVASQNAIKHGLNQKIDLLAHPAVAAIAELYIQEGIDPEAARQLALAHVERERVRSARVDVWRSEYHLEETSSHGQFHQTSTEAYSDVALLVLKRLSVLNRYEVRAVSHLSKAARAAFL